MLALSLVRLQHRNELTRSTATGPLLADERMRLHANVETLTWHGACDNDHLDQQLSSLVSPALVWAEDGKAADTSPLASAGTTYVLLDGTWQETQELFSKGPQSLRRMRCVTLPAASSSYWMRSPFAGRARFGEAASDGGGLVCTAEAASALLEMEGDAAGGATLRGLLQEFQDAHASAHPRLFKAKMRLQRKRRDPAFQRAAEERRAVRAWRAGRRQRSTS